MSWLNLSLHASAYHAECLSDALLELGALSVDINDAHAGTAAEQPLFGEPGSPSGEIWADAKITALFAADAEIAGIVRAAAAAAGLDAPPEFVVQKVEEQDWVRLTQAQFAPIQISERLWIVPSWHTAPDSAALNLILDPGLAFGTGSHPTTRLCLSWLDRHVEGGETVLDYGCGSGILAIAALKLGAARVIGIDIDPQAIAASRDNAGRNDCDARKISFDTPQVSAGGTLNEVADIVVANILANPLIVLAPILAQATRPGGQIVLSGILVEQSADVLRVYQQWFEMCLAEQEGDWVLLAGKKLNS